MENFLPRSSNNISLSEFYQGYKLTPSKYNLSPPYQRRGDVWSLELKSFLIDSILKNFPLPPIFLHQIILKDGTSRYDVIDGKQRLTSIIDFIEDKVPVPDFFGDDIFGDDRLNGLLFSEIKKDDALSAYIRHFWKYQLTIEYIDTDSGETIDNIFDRLNRNGEVLTPQELRKAQFYHSDLYKIIIELAEIPFWKTRLSNLRVNRMADHEFISEILFVLLEDGKVNSAEPKDIDDLYKKWNDNFDDIDISEIKNRFILNTKFIESLKLDFKKYKIGRSSHLYGLWAFADYCVKNSIGPEKVRAKLVKMFEGLRSGNTKDKNILDYKKSMDYGTRTKAQRAKRLEAIKKYCSLE
ncbi:DUF262 domain-containing protein [Ruminiclostridium papyrosolvens]|uniref:GmrSD restriction endonucleases N-terminal domain-containing protein n=1 Tax=Ruminiclostridium papyrosolvens C7 TaxID=1330534 RepID=U4QY04_9FIRM|nr:DUF262 domain-containing protein [Ruminiclostridium papyrosolvens]EPR07797.1 hypothetical protein L323_20090 [Ruminiclostridium papyrosolvens C7]